MNKPNKVTTDFALDTQSKNLNQIWNDFKAKISAGDLGPIPALLAIISLVTIFGLTSPESFLTANNFANFLDQASAVIIIAMAVTFVLLLGEIDLAAGFIAGISAAVLATRLSDGWSLLTAVLLATFAAFLLGSFTGYMVAKVGIPSFVVTLANFLSFQGILLLLIKEGGSIRIQNETIKDLVGGRLNVTQSWLFSITALILYAIYLLVMKKSNDKSTPISLVLIKLFTAATITIIITMILTKDRSLPRATEAIRGLPIVVPLILLLLVALTFLLSKTRYGLYLYAVGANAEAVRRAGINVVRIRLIAFILTALVSAIGGAFLASRVNSVDPNTGANDTLLLAVGAAVIGGTSLFGGKGLMVNAVLGGLVLALIPNGLGLVGKRILFDTEIDFGSSGIKFICAGLALLAAASVDALTRKRSSAN